MFNRTDLIQQIVNRKNAKKYLEIGVHDGFNFLNIKCKKKIAVDPEFKISNKKKATSFLKNTTNICNEYYELTSDDFFVNYAEKIKSISPHVVFIDGLHTFEQSLKDCYNSLNCIADDGIIIMHDCNPPNAASATLATSIPEAEKKWKLENDLGWTGEWCGDVWKTIPYIIKNNPELDVTVLNADYGLGIIRRSTGLNPIVYRINNEELAQLEKLSYEDLSKDREKILNLIELDEIDLLLDNLC